MPSLHPAFVISGKRRIFFGALICFAPLLAGCAARVPRAGAPGFEPGRVQFENYCAGCHIDDSGVRGDTPPLEGSSWVTGPEGRLIKIALHGVRGPIEVQDKTYDQEMPGFGAVLSDADIAALLSFVRRRFGGLNSPVTPAAVNAVRAAWPDRTSYWSVDELLKSP